MPIPPEPDDSDQLAVVPWYWYKKFFVDDVLTPLLEIFDSTYSGKEVDFADDQLHNTTLHLQRIRELLTLRGAGQPPIDTALLEKMMPYNRLIMEYQLKTDINEDGKIYGWDYRYSEPQPFISGVPKVPGALVIPGEMPPDGLYNGP